MILHQVKNFAAQFIDALLPPRCVITGELVDEQGMISSSAWQDLQFIADPFCAHCGIPFEYEVEKDLVCTSCLDHPPPFSSHRSALYYNDTSRSLILGFKHADKTHVVRSFVPWLQRTGEDVLKRADYLMPVPLHYWRLVSRRYNQAALIAQFLGQASGVPVSINALRRTRATVSQGHLSAKARHKNVKRAFAVSDQYKEQVQGKVIILIDDVYTTGATLKACTKALLSAGAGEVHCLSIARVVKDIDID